MDSYARHFLLNNILYRWLIVEFSKKIIILQWDCTRIKISQISSKIAFSLTWVHYFMVWHFLFCFAFNVVNQFHNMIFFLNEKQKFAQQRVNYDLYLCKSTCERWSFFFLLLLFYWVEFSEQYNKSGVESER